jgi:hypothetical protein
MQFDRRDETIRWANIGTSQVNQSQLEKQQPNIRAFVGTID